MILTKTASVLLTDQEVDALRNGLRILYRPLTMHWDGQFGKFLEEPEPPGPAQVNLDGTPLEQPEEINVVHLQRDTGRTYTDKETGKVRPMIVKVGSWLIKEISDDVPFPPVYCIDYDNLEAMDQCWAVVLGQKV